MSKRIVAMLLCLATLISIFSCLEISATDNYADSDVEYIEDDEEIIEDEEYDFASGAYDTVSEDYNIVSEDYSSSFIQADTSEAASEFSLMSLISTLSVFDNAGNYAEAVILPVGSRVNVAAIDAMRIPLTYQWQIQVRDGVWADITGEASSEISITYAMIANLLNDNGYAVIRCSALTADGEFASNEVAVYVDYSEVPSPEHEFEQQAIIVNEPTLSENAQDADDGIAVASEMDDAVISNMHIAINYTFGDGTVVHEPWMASEVVGGGISQDVIIPSVLGYAAHVDSITVGGIEQPLNTTDSVLYQGDNITISFIDGIQKKISLSSENLGVQDIVINVVYLPSNTTFTIKHYLQNISNDDYTLDEQRIEVVSASLRDGTIPVITGHTVGEYYRTYIVEGKENHTLSYKYDGFYPLNYDSNVVIAADGSTVIEIYYDRYYYLMDFSLDGGYGVEPIYAKFGSFIYDGNAITKLPEELIPKKAGFDFLGWTIIEPSKASDIFEENPSDPFHLSSDLLGYFEGSYDTFPATMPAVNMAYKANWKAGLTSFTIEYVLQDPDNPAVYTYFHNVVIGGIESDTEINLYDYKNEYFDLFEFELGEEDADSANPLIVRAKKLGFNSIEEMNNAIPRDVRRGSYYDAATTLKLNNNNSLVTVKGDGSTLVKIYYSRREFTLKFIYAATEGNADAAYDSYSVVGGSTYYFGSWATIAKSNRKNEYNLLAQYFGDNAQRKAEVGTVKPSSGDDYIIKLNYIKDVAYNPDSTNVNKDSGIYTLDRYYDSTTNCTYRFFTLKALYGASLYELWPTADMFNSVTRYGPDDSGKIVDKGAAVFAGWNPEYSTNFAQDQNNETIKSRYARLDEQLMFDVDNTTSVGWRSDDSTISFLAFWENGAENGWSKPSVYEYNIMVELTQPDIDKYLEAAEYYDAETNTFTEGYTGKLTVSDYLAIVTRTVNGTTNYYYLWDKYNVVDNNQGTNDNGAIGDDDRTSHPAPSYPNMALPVSNSNQDYIDWEKLSTSEYDTSVYQYAYRITYYYARNNFSFVLANSDNSILVDKSLPFNYDISACNDYVPPYPAGAEAGSLEFMGWYTDPELGEKYVFDVMPMNNVKLFARWSSATYHINLYLNHDDYLKDLNAATYSSDENGNPTVTVPTDNVLKIGDTVYSKPIKYGEYLTGLPTAETMATQMPNLNFAGWYYVCHDHSGEEHAFNDQIPVSYSMVTFANGLDTGRIDLYAKWVSTYLETYRVYFIASDERGNILASDGTKMTYNEDGSFANDPLYVADPIIGSALGGTTKTFEAKTGDELYEDYRNKGYYPNVASHSMDMQVVSDSDTATNTFYFVYRYAAPVTYQVVYLDAETGEIITKDAYNNDVKQPEKTVTSDAVVTAFFGYIPGYVPDAYKKRVILVAESLDSEGNEKEDIIYIAFYYTRSETEAPYISTYYVQNLDGETYSEYLSYQYVGEIGQAYSMTEMNIQGFAYNAEKSKSSGKLEATGLVLTMYYDRLSYDYEVQYLINGTADAAAEAKTGSAKYQATVTESAITIPGYRLVDVVTEKSINILVEPDSTKVANNIIKFYYEPLQVVINYQLVGPADSGKLSNQHETVNSAYIDESDKIEGSIATASDKYNFLGWFTMDSEGKYVKVVASNTVWLSEDGTEIIPLRALNPTGDTPTNTEIPYLSGNQTYYAIFEAKETVMTITRTGVDSIDADQSFVYRIAGADDNTRGIVLTVTVHIPANKTSGSVTINEVPVGAYTVTEVTDWAWRYAPIGGSVSQAITAKPSEIASLEFSGARTNPYWLNGMAYKNNKFN